MLNDHQFLVLNSLYLKKMASAADLAAISGLSVDEVQPIVSGFVEQEWVLDLGGELVIQPEGMAEVEGYYHESYAEPAQRAALAQWYSRFESVNSKFIKLVTDWQETEGDTRVQDRVIATVERLVKSLGEITQLVPRYTGYIRRFERSVELVDQGNLDFVCTPTVDSLHNIWFELHEDVLLALGKERTE